MDTKTKQYLKSKAHALKPIVLLGHQGFTQAVKREMDQALNDHELIKIRYSSLDKEERKILFKEIANSLTAELIQVIGSIAVLYRKKD